MPNWGPDYVRSRVGKFLETLGKVPDQQAGIRDGRTMPSPDGLNIGYARRMTVSILFFDLASFTHRVSLTPSEKILALLNAVIPEMMYIVRDWGGIVEKNTGDGIMAYFGTETTSAEKAAQDAVDAATTMRYALRNWVNPALSTWNMEPVHYRIGIDMGEVLIAKIGVHSLNHLVAIGNAANIASKLQGIAPVDGILLGGQLYVNLPEYERKYCHFYQAPSDWAYTWTEGILSGLPYPSYSYAATWRQPS